MRRMTVLAVLLLLVPTFLISAAGGQEKTEATGAKYVIQWAPLSTPVDDEGPIVKFMEEKFNVDFEMWDRSEGAALNVRIAAGEIPDFFAAGNNEYRIFVEDGVLAEVPIDALKKFAPNMYQKYQGERRGAIEERLIDGKLWCLPNSDAETGGTRAMIAYRGDWLEAVGYDSPPETITALEDVLYKFAKNDPDGNGKKDTFGISKYGMSPVFGAFGGIPIDGYHTTGQWSVSNGKVVYDAIQPEMKQALALLRKWYADGVIDPEFVQGEAKGTPFSRFAFMSGQVGMTTDQYLYLKNESMVEGDRIARNIAEMQRLNPRAVEEIQYGTPPVGPGGKRGTPMHSPFHGWFLGFGKHLEKDPDKMAIILQINDYATATDDGFLTTRYGFLGEHWWWQNDVVDSLVIQHDDLLQWHQITEIGGGICFSSIWFPSIQSRVNNNLKWAIERHPEVYEDGYSNAVHLPLPSAGKYQAELDKIRDEAYYGIITGQRPLESFDAFVQEWKKNGGDILITEANDKQ